MRTTMDLIAEAIRARERAYAPYSMFRVGAALLASDGRIYSGCNVESASLGLTVCAERVALLKAVSEGVRRVERMAIVADGPEPTAPCGACRQMIWEFADEQTEIIFANLTGQVQAVKIGQLLPRPFDSSVL